MASEFSEETRKLIFLEGLKCHLRRMNADLMGAVLPGEEPIMERVQGCIIKQIEGLRNIIQNLLHN